MDIPASGTKLIIEGFESLSLNSVGGDNFLYEKFNG